MGLMTSLESRLKQHKSKLKPFLIISAVLGLNYGSFKAGESVEELKHIDLEIENQTLSEEYDICYKDLSNKYYELNDCHFYFSKCDNFNDILLKDNFDKSIRLLASKRYKDLNDLDIEDLKNLATYVLYKEGKDCEYNLSACQEDIKECIMSLDKLFMVNYQ